jgi:hypothetical protein
MPQIAIKLEPPAQLRSHAGRRLTCALAQCAPFRRRNNSTLTRHQVHACLDCDQTLYEKMAMFAVEPRAYLVP